MESEKYRTDKITRVFTLYQALISGKSVNKEMFCFDHGVSERGFDRDIQDIRLFLSESYSGEEVIYDREDNSYSITGSRPAYMDKFDAAIIIKLVLSTGGIPGGRGAGACGGSASKPDAERPEERAGLLAAGFRYLQGESR